MTTNNQFIMLPKVDFCFKELMHNPKVRNGFISAILDFNHFDDDHCYRTINFRDDITGAIYSDMLEIKILELKKLKKNLQNIGTGTVYDWMRFFNGKNKEDFENMAKENEYFEEAYHTLLTLSADDQKRLEYEARQKALRDYNSQMNNARKEGEAIGQRRGEEIGQRRGELQGIDLAKRIFKLHMDGKSEEEIALQCNLPVTKVHEILN